MVEVIDSDVCISCGICAEVCPCVAIKEGALSYVINSDICIDCGICESYCPVEAISAPGRHPSSENKGDNFSPSLRPSNSKDKFKRGI